LEEAEIMLATRGMICEELFDCAAFVGRHDCADAVNLLMKARCAIQDDRPVDSTIPALQDVSEFPEIVKLPFLRARVLTLISMLRRLSQ
jgi:hypothetical protein